MKLQKRSYLLNKEEHMVNGERYYFIDIPSKLHNLYRDEVYHDLEAYMECLDNSKKLALDPMEWVIFKKVKYGG